MKRTVFPFKFPPPLGYSESEGELGHNLSTLVREPFWLTLRPELELQLVVFDPLTGLMNIPFSILSFVASFSFATL